MFTCCPKCKSVATVPIAYGKPSCEMLEAAEYGLIHLAGCVIADERIDRYCKACGAEWISSVKPKREIDHRQEMTCLLDQMEAELKEQQRNIERVCIDMGRNGIFGDDCLLESLIQILYHYHEVWRDFTYGLHTFGGQVLIEGSRGGIEAQYDIETAHIYIKKMLLVISGGIGRLAMSCYRLGLASDKGTADEMKQAMVDMQQAKVEINRNWLNLKQTAFCYR